MKSSRFDVSTFRRFHPTVRYLLDHYVELLTVLTLLFVLQTGLVPFDFGSAAGTGGESLFSAEVTRLTFPDVISNIFLYFPLGMLAHWSLCRMAGGGRLVFLATVAFAACLSGSIEWIQAYSPSRVSSVIDLVSNVLGASLGAAVSTIARWIMPQLMGTALVEFHERPLPAMLKTYCVVLVVFAAIPFSFSFDRVRLKESVQAVNWIPFADQSANVRYGFMGPQVVDSDHQRWDRMKRWSRWTVECASFAVLAWLLVMVLRNHYGFGRWSTWMLVAWIGAGFATALSILQLPIVSRACDATDVVFRLLGLGLGCFFQSRYERRTEGLPAWRLAVVHRELAALACAVVGVYVLYTGLIPMRFSAGLDGPAQSLSADGFLPFFAYYMARFDIMMGDVLEKFIAYVLLAATLAACWAPVRDRNTASQLVTVTMFCFVISAVIEISQMFIPVRVTSLTDPILAVAGAVVGVLGQRNTAQFYRFATAGDDAVAPPAEQPTPMSPTDELVGTLIDPYPDAPVETVPAPGLQRTHD